MTIEETYQQINDLIDDKKFNDCLTLLDKKIEEFPSDNLLKRTFAEVNYALNNYDVAIKTFEELLSLNENDIDLLEFLGNSYSFKHDYQNATKILNRVIEIDPKNFGIKGLLAKIYFKQRKYKLSLEYIDELIETDQNCSDKNLIQRNILKSQIYTKLDAPTKAINILKELNIKFPNTAEVMSLLGYRLATANKAEEGLEVLLKAEKIEPSEQIYNGLGIVYNFIGEIEKSRKYLKKCLEINPDNFEVFRNLSTMTKFTKGNKYIKKYEEYIEKRTDLTNENKIDIGFSLGKYYHDQKEFDLAFKYYQIANDIIDLSFNYAVEAEDQQYNDLIKIFNDETIKLYQEDYDDDIRTIFIVGMPRSGTSLTEQIIGAHSMVHQLGEQKYIINLIKYFNDRINDGAKFDKETKYNQTAELIRFLRNDFITEVKKSSKNYKIFTEKMPFNYKFVGFIKTLFPKAKIIYCKRNPMDNCASIYRTYFANGNIGWAYNLNKIGKVYNIHETITEYWKTIFKNDIYTLSYESLVDDFDNEARKLISFVELDWEDSCQKFYKAKSNVITASSEQVRRPIYKDSVLSYRNYSKYLSDLENQLKNKGV